jgi:hypothetical protein
MHALGWFWLASVSMGCGEVNQVAAPVDASPDGPGCVPPPNGLQARWRGEMNASRRDRGPRRHRNIQPVHSGRHGAAFVFDGIEVAMLHAAPDGICIRE